jgi:hypothetical protein
MSIYTYLSTVKFDWFRARSPGVWAGSAHRPARTADAEMAHSKRDIVVHVAVAGAGCDRTAGRGA